MLKNYFITAWRALKKNQSFTLINILGLSLGLTTCMFIVLYTADELNFDRYNKKYDQIYRVNEDLKLGANKVTYAACMAPLAQALKNDFPEIENTVRIQSAWSHNIKKGNSNIRENNICFADPSLFQVFTLPMVYGDPQTALKEPNTIVLTETMAQKYFSTTNALNKVVTLDDNTRLKVTAVIRDIPAESHFHADFLISMSSNPESRSPAWLRSNFNTYILLSPKTDPETIEKRFPRFLARHSAAQMKTELKMSLTAFENGGNFFRLNLIPLTQIHLHSNRSAELGANSTVQYIYILSTIALFVLLVACLNFMNLATARSSNRAREVGVRKVLGSARSYLVSQFLIESLLVTILAAALSLVIFVALLPYFNQLAGKDIRLSTNIFLWLIPTLASAALVIGLLAGIYPALFLSAFKPVDVLKGKIAAGFKSAILRNALVVIQFTVSVILVIGTLVIYKQIIFIAHRNPGYDRRQVLIVHNAYELGTRTHTFKQQIKALSGVIDATLTGYLPTAANRSTAIFYKAQLMDPKNSLFPQTWRVDEDYLGTLGIRLSAGRNFSQKFPSDSSAVIINEAAAKALGFSDPVNRTIYRSLGGDSHILTPSRIIGVIKDFNFNSLRENISPLVLTLAADNGDLSVRLRPDHLPMLLRQIEQRWRAASTAKFDYSFMDADFDAGYRAEQQIARLFLVFTALAILIACLGLYGLAAYAAEQRTREIGIRKVLGAALGSLVSMLTRDFLRPVLIGIFLALPLGYLVMNRWLQEFAYRDKLSWIIFALAGAGAFLIALSTVSFQAIRASMTNPVDSLKSE